MREIPKTKYPKSPLYFVSLHAISKIIDKYTFMLKIGDYNTLEIAKMVDFGAYLYSSGTEILLPKKYVPTDAKVGQMIEVFIYTDSEDRLIATTLKPIAKVGEFAYLEVMDNSPFGSFVEIGIEKHILVPLSEQPMRMEVGKKYVMYVYLDTITGRMVASARLNRFVEKEVMDLKENQAVPILVANPTDLGFNVIVDNLYWGLVYHSDIFKRISVGDLLTGYVKKIREDNKLDIVLQPQGFKKVIGSDTQTILNALAENKNVLYLSDKTEPEVIYKALGMSKKAFKKAIGVLYKEEKILIFSNRIQTFTED